jgi:ABC-type sugar transport system ATPase subunit
MSMQPPPLLELRGISKAFPGVQALDDVSFAVQRGRVHALLGANGAGKSTLIKILVGALQRDAGEILLDGQPVALRNPQEAAHLGIACIFQDPALVPRLSAEQNIFLGQEIKRLGFIAKGLQRKRAAELLAPLAPHLSPGRPVGTLRTSERQLVALAKALLSGNRIVIMDEPSASMTDIETAALFSAIQQLRSSGVCVIYTSHRLEEVFQIADEVTVLRDGRHVRTCAIAEVNRSELVNLIVGRELRIEERRRDIDVGNEVLSVHELTRDGVFKNVTFSVRAGEIVALAGLVGAGRSEVARAILAADPVTSGTVSYPKRKKRVRQPSDAVKAGIMMIPEDRKKQGIIPKMAVGDNIMLSSITRYVNRVLGLIQAQKVQRAIKEHVRQLDIRPRGAEKRPIQTLSGGNQQKVLVARAIESEANLLIFDEPTAGVDIGTKAEIHRLIVDLAARGKGILLISSETEEVLTLADRILIMRGGRLIGELEGHAASSHDVLKHALGEQEQRSQPV